MPDHRPAPQVRYVPAAPQKTPARKTIVRAVFVALWLLILLIPGFFIWMVINGEFTLSLGSTPEQKLRVWLVSEIRERGFGISTGSVASQTETDVCVQTDLRYLLWQGSQAPSTYCECFTRTTAEDTWSYNGGWEGMCSVPPQEPES